jgi:hypothetical protein
MCRNRGRFLMPEVGEVAHTEAPPPRVKVVSAARDVLYLV